jgi:hypothetical protein
VLLLVATLASAFPQVPGLDNAAPQTWALLVGISRYPQLGAGMQLPGADADARALARFLESPRGGAVPPHHVQVLVNQEATLRNLRVALDRLIRSTRHGDTAWIFFAGHGTVEWYGGGEVGYLLACDSDPRMLNATALPMDELRRYVDVNLHQAASIVLITDACHAGALGRGSDPTETDRRPLGSVNDRLLDIGESSSVLNLMACRRDEQAVEDSRFGGHGVLTYCLLKALNGAGGASARGVVRAEDVLEYVMREVPLLTDGRQHPRHGSSYSDEFPMAWLDRAGPDLALPPLPWEGRASASLRVVGAPAGSDVLLVQGGEQRTVGRPLEDGNVLVVDGLPPGTYLLVQSQNGALRRWTVELRPGLQTFDLERGKKL